MELVKWKNMRTKKSMRKMEITVEEVSTPTTEKTMMTMLKMEVEEQERNHLESFQVYCYQYQSLNDLLASVATFFAALLVSYF